MVHCYLSGSRECMFSMHKVVGHLSACFTCFQLSDFLVRVESACFPCIWLLVIWGACSLSLWSSLGAPSIFFMSQLDSAAVTLLLKHYHWFEYHYCHGYNCQYYSYRNCHHHFLICMYFLSLVCSWTILPNFVPEQLPVDWFGCYTY